MEVNAYEVQLHRILSQQSVALGVGRVAALKLIAFKEV
jgi:hypothetical protein